VKKIIAAIACLFILISTLHFFYPLDYVWRVLVHQDSDTKDFLWQPKAHIKAPPTSNPLLYDTQESKIEDMFESDKEINDLDAFLSSTKTTSLIIIKDSTIIYEKYLEGHNAESLMPIFSVSKSVISLLLGRAIERGEIQSLETSITEYVPELNDLDESFSKITFSNLIDMQSGVRYDGDESFPFINSDDALIYYSNDLKSILLKELEIESEPGRSSFEYNDYNPNLIALALQRQSGKSISELVSERIWKPMGAEYGGYWVTDWNDFPRAESGLVIRSIDLARIGKVMLFGNSNGSVISEDWRKRSLNRLTEHEFEEYNGKQWGYSTGWWIISRLDKPHDVSAIGAHGQYLYLSPANNIIIVRTGSEETDWGDADFISLFYRSAALLNENLK